VFSVEGNQEGISMFVVTNRKVNTRKEGLDLFGDTPNTVGPNELRLVKVTKQGSHYTTELLADRLTQAEVRELKRRHALDIDERADWFASLRVACDLMEQAAREKRHLLVYVHGYNNDMKDVLGTAETLEALYNVIVLPFSWPANGGGAVRGTAAYLDDKQDARVSMDALNRFFEKVQLYHEKLTEARRDAFWQQAMAEDGGRGNREAVQARFTQLLAEDCKVTLNLMCHSMGNYVLKYALQPSAAAAARLIFDNVSLVAADANNAALKAVFSDAFEGRRAEDRLSYAADINAYRLN
jgi:esterase/lipase superfamily enzyme